MRRLLLQLDADRHPSAFDRIVAYDAGAEEVLSYGGVSETDVQGLVHGAIFTRGPKDLKHTALFVGGSNIPLAEALLKAARNSFFGPFQTSILFDPNGSNTTAAAAVVKLVKAASDLRDKPGIVFAGTGPVGARAAGLLLRLGARVRITSREAAHGSEVAAQIGTRFGGTVAASVVRSPEQARALLADAAVALAAGPAGVQIVPRDAWIGCPALRAVADVNAVPPAGIEGVEAPDNGAVKDGVACFGALGIGSLKMKTHKAAVAQLFERNDRVLDAEEIYDIAAAL